VDLAAVCLLHLTACLLCLIANERRWKRVFASLSVRVELAVDLGIRQLIQRNSVVDAGVVYKDIERAESILSLCKRPTYVGSVQNTAQNHHTTTIIGAPDLMPQGEPSFRS
jgi:hypothetical protein